MTFTITKSFSFSASHQLDGLPEDHKCSRLHGHNYTVVLVVDGKLLDDAGMIFDYGRLQPFADWLAETVEHRHLNDVVDFNPTAELLAAWFCQTASKLLTFPEDARLSAVRVCETLRTTAEYAP